MQLPPACPEIPVRSLEEAVAYYRDRMGFALDWSDQESGLAGLSQGDCRIFVATGGYRELLGTVGPALLWLNLTSRAEVDELYRRWSLAGVVIASPPSAKSFKLYEFFAKDPDGNYFRAFYDFSWEERLEPTSTAPSH